MKKVNTIILAIAIVSSSLIFASFSNQNTNEDIEYTYCRLVGIQKFMSKKVNIKIDYGQKTKLFQDTRLKGENGKAMTFNSMVDAVNFMAKDGWILDMAYPLSTGNQNVYHYLMKKVVD